MNEPIMHRSMVISDTAGCVSNRTKNMNGYPQPVSCGSNGDHTSKGKLAVSTAFCPISDTFHHSTPSGTLAPVCEPLTSATFVFVIVIKSHDCHPSFCMFPGPSFGWYRMNIKLKRQEKPMHAVIGAHMDLRNRKKRKTVKPAIAKSVLVSAETENPLGRMKWYGTKDINAS